MIYQYVLLCRVKIDLLTKICIPYDVIFKYKQYLLNVTDTAYVS